MESKFLKLQKDIRIKKIERDITEENTCQDSIRRTGSAR